jgi:hypothetical protein
MLAVESGPQRITTIGTSPVRGPVKLVTLSKIESPWIAHLRLILMLRINVDSMVPEITNNVN